MNPAQSPNQTTLKYPLPRPNLAKEMEKTKSVSNASSVSTFAGATKKRNQAKKGSHHTASTSKQDAPAKNPAINPRRRKRQFASNGSRSTRQLRRNERERGRKARLNAAFQVLRSVVPDASSTRAGTTERKMTQVEILRLAKNYISNLTEILQTNSDSCTFNSYRCVCDWMPLETKIIQSFQVLPNAIRKGPVYYKTVSWWSLVRALHKKGDL